MKEARQKELEAAKQTKQNAKATENYKVNDEEIIDDKTNKEKEPVSSDVDLMAVKKTKNKKRKASESLAFAQDETNLPKQKKNKKKKREVIENDAEHKIKHNNAIVEVAEKCEMEEGLNIPNDDTGKKRKVNEKAEVEGENTSSKKKKKHKAAKNDKEENNKIALDFEKCESPQNSLFDECNEIKTIVDKQKKRKDKKRTVLENNDSKEEALDNHIKDEEKPEFVENGERAKQKKTSKKKKKQIENKIAVNNETKENFAFLENGKCEEKKLSKKHKKSKATANGKPIISA